mmetsp:Transcript_10705/g.35850  ORF Transcript_10705/g.35850 Transcript_10705/m.35850 type:complete len:200 (-) Transcript_10705:450-1049(-)
MYPRAGVLLSSCRHYSHLEWEEKARRDEEYLKNCAEYPIVCLVDDALLLLILSSRCCLLSSLQEDRPSGGTQVGAMSHPSQRPPLLLFRCLRPSSCSPHAREGPGEGRRTNAAEPAGGRDRLLGQHGRACSAQPGIVCVRARRTTKSRKLARGQGSGRAMEFEEEGQGLKLYSNRCPRWRKSRKKRRRRRSKTREGRLT